MARSNEKNSGRKGLSWALFTIHLKNFLQALGGFKLRISVGGPGAVPGEFKKFSQLVNVGAGNPRVGQVDLELPRRHGVLPDGVFPASGPFWRSSR